MAALEQHQARSPDGTTLGALRSGAGPALVLVHGSGVDRTAWARVAKRLARSHTVLTYDRRGRGTSDDGPAYALAREVEDLHAVLTLVEGPAHVVTQSFGGLVALAGAAHPQIARLTLHEPPVPTPGEPFWTGQLLASVSADLADGRDEEAALTFMAVAIGLSPREVAAVRDDDRTWRATLGAMRTALREGREIHEFRLGPALAQLALPVTVLVGGASPVRFAAAAAAVVAAVPHGRTVVLANQGHLAAGSSPDALVEAIVAAEAPDR